MRFGYFGRFASMKGLHFLVGAFCAIAGRYDCELHLHGDGPEMPAIRELVRSLQLQGHIIFHGAYAQSELDDLIEAVDVGIMPSTYEGFGIVMLELMSRGRPVIASDVGSSREVLEEMGGGWVVPKADTAALSECMKFCVENPDEVRKAGRAGEEVWMKSFSPEKMFERYLRFWNA